MPLVEPFPPLEQILQLIGEAGSRLAEIEASEGAAGNISVYLGWDVEPRHAFPIVAQSTLPTELPDLVGRYILFTGSGRRLREIGRDARANLGVLRVNDDAVSAAVYTAPQRLFDAPTSELNSHLAIHNALVHREKLMFHAVVHAQPLHLTYLSHVPRYQDAHYLNTHILRWQPETLVNLPRGIACLPFLMPGSAQLMNSTVRAMDEGHRVVLWGQHGVIARSDLSIKRAVDRIEYAETGARYEYMNLVAGEPATGLSTGDLRAIADHFGIKQNLF